MLLALVMTAAATAAPAEPAPAPPWPAAMTLEEAAKGRLKGVGTEPFWGMEINSPTITMTEPGDEDVKATEFRIEYTAQAGPDVHVWTSGPLSVTVSSGECSDGMSDTVFPYKVEATLMGEETRNLKGCAYRPWGEDVVAAMPVIDACLRASGGQPPVVYAAATAPDAGFALLAGSDEDPLQGCVRRGRQGGHRLLPARRGAAGRHERGNLRARPGQESRRGVLRGARGSGRRGQAAGLVARPAGLLEHHPKKWTPVLRKDDARSKT